MKPRVQFYREQYTFSPAIATQEKKQSFWTFTGHGNNP